MPDDGASLKTLLVVDDEPQVLAALSDLLEDEFEVLSQTSPAGALDLLRRMPDISVVMSDQRKLPVRRVVQVDRDDTGGQHMQAEQQRNQQQHEAGAGDPSMRRGSHAQRASKASTLAAQMMSLSDRPPTSWVDHSSWQWP